MRNRFDQELQKLRTTLITMGLLVEKSINYTLEALESEAEHLLKESRLLDEEINTKEREIESLCLKLILQQQPVAKDLRIISSALKMITDLERIGDQCLDIVEIAIQQRGKGCSIDHIVEMGSATKYMVSKSIESYVKQSTQVAYQVIAEDDRVDDLFRKVRKDVIALLHEEEESAIDILMIGKYFERIGDHAVNVAEWSLFTITGQHKDYQIMEQMSETSS